jgi:dipeptidyl aminopeptidase/acylaminoacyl peptidase
MKRAARSIASRSICNSIVSVLLSAAVVVPAAAKDPDSIAPEYRMPPQAIADLIDAAPTPGVSISPSQRWALLMERPSLPSIEEVAQPELRLAGMRINPRTNGRSRRSYNTRLILKSVADGKETIIGGLPTEPRIQNVRWSPDSATVAFTITRDGGIELWSADVATARARRLTEPRLNAAYASPYEWLPDSKSLICLLVPLNRGSAPQAPTTPTGPILQENIGRKSPARTYQDLLTNTHDEALFDHYMTSQVVRVTLDGRPTPQGSPGIFAQAEPSPNGQYLLTERLHRPYSYLVPASRFPRKLEIWDRNGQLVKAVAEIPLAEEVPIGFGAVRTGPRSFGWRADEPATLYWAEAQDGGDPKNDVEIRDRVYTLATPFENDAVELVALGMRYGGMSWGDNRLALASEWWWKSRRSRTWIVNPSAPGSEATLLFDRSFEDRYNDPGQPLFRRTDAGTSVLLTADGGRSLFLSGQGASPEGNRPFLDRLELASKKTERLWRSEAPYYESVVDVLDADKLTLLTRRESKNEPPNYFLRDLQKDKLNALTTFPHPTPALKDVYKEMLRYKRADGVMLTATLYLPPGKKPQDGPFPMLMMAYPREFKSADAAGQVTDSPYRFVRTGAHSSLLWLVHGYAILDGPTLPIIGEGDEEPNDSYVKQLVSGAQAAVDEVVRLGVADRNRIAIAGHSYGAFMTANLLAHCDLFQAGIARSGAYNRTLTPFGFQAEERTFWEAPEVYFAMSPFMHAEKINEPILLIHGEVDNNSGTFPIQSRRFYHALKGHGATARLVMLPHESHGYRARESVMHMAWEMTTWLDKYINTTVPREKQKPEEALKLWE